MTAIQAEFQGATVKVRGFADLASYLYGAALGVATLLLASKIWKLPLPCGEGNPCETLAATRIGLFFGIPVSLVAVFVIGFCYLSLVVPPLKRLGLVVSITTCFYAGWIQVQSFRAFELVCGWCLACTVLVLAATIFRSVGQGLKGRLPHVFGLMGLLSPLIALPLTPAGQSETKGTAFSLDRTILTGDCDPKEHVIVLVGSPTCSTCVAEARMLLDTVGTRDVRLRFFHAPVSPDPMEAKVAARIKRLLEVKDSSRFSNVTPGAPLASMLAATENVFTDSDQESRYLAECALDRRQIGKLALQEIPQRYDCPPEQVCRSAPAIGSN